MMNDFLKTGNNQYLVNYHVVPLGDTSPPPGLRANDNRAFEANIAENHPDYSFYTSERNDGHEDRFCRNGNYNPDEVRPTYRTRNLAEVAIRLYRQHPCAVLDRASSQGDNLGSRRIMER